MLSLCGFKTRNNIKMTRFILLIVTLLFNTSGFSQSEKSVEINDKMSRLQQKNEQMALRIQTLESQIYTLTTEAEANVAKVKIEIKRGQELQAQSERAMNIALDDFSEQFNKKNEIVQGIQQKLNQKFNNQMVVFALGFLALVIIFVISSRNSTKKALTQNASNWNNFQEHLLKK